MILKLLLIFCLSTLASTQNCTSCVSSGNIWCVETSQCSNSTSPVCQTSISLPLNCPTLPMYPYDDNFMRTQHLTFASASHGQLIQTCFDNQIPTMKLFKSRTVNCSTDSSYVSCVGYTAYDVTQKVIVVSFRGVHEPNQHQQMVDGYAKEGLHSYPGIGGEIFKVIYDIFMVLWNSGGMEQDLRSLKYMYPNFELWINGHSLGGMFTLVASSYLVSIGLYKPENIKVVAFAAPRIGDYDFASWYTATFSYSFHIVHDRDIVPRFNPIDPHTNTTVLFHPKHEVWYQNDMKVGDPYQICEEADGSYCSDGVTEGLTWDDRIYYFDLNMSTWGRDGCPKNRSSYAHP